MCVMLTLSTIHSNYFCCTLHILPMIISTQVTSCPLIAVTVNCSGCDVSFILWRYPAHWVTACHGGFAFYFPCGFPQFCRCRGRVSRVFSALFFRCGRGACLRTRVPGCRRSSLSLCIWSRDKKAPWMSSGNRRTLGESLIAGLAELTY